jgi:hypothetical protein
MLFPVYPHLGDSWKSAREASTSRLPCFTAGFPGTQRVHPFNFSPPVQMLCIGAVKDSRMDTKSIGKYFSLSAIFMELK